MRGEEFPFFVVKETSKELPPHARRRDYDYQGVRVEGGITSACAEKRIAAFESLVIVRNYLRMRGEERVHTRIRAFT